MLLAQPVRPGTPGEYALLAIGAKPGQVVLVAGASESADSHAVQLLAARAPPWWPPVPPMMPPGLPGWEQQPWWTTPPGPGRPAGLGRAGVAGYRRPGHLVEGGHIGSGHRAAGLSVARTLAGVLASGAQGVPVVVVQPPADAEVAGIA